MQPSFSQGCFPDFHYPHPPSCNYYYPPPNNYYYPPPPPSNYYDPMHHGYNQSPPSYYYNPFPGSWFNVGGNLHDGPGIQRNGSLILGNGSEVRRQTVKQERRKPTIIGGCHGNQRGHQVSGDINLGHI